MLVSSLSTSSRAIKGQGHSTVAISCCCRVSNSSKQGEGHSQYTVTHTLPKVASSSSSVSVTSVNCLQSQFDQHTVPNINIPSLLGWTQLVSASSRFTRRNYTVPLKYTPSVNSLEPIICPWEVLVIAGPSHPPKEKYFTFRTTTPS